MDEDALRRLNDTFAIDGRVAFDAGAGGMARARVRGGDGEAEVYLRGAHVTTFRPRSADPVLWMSPLAEFRDGRAIRGGIPIVFPWFGPHPDDAGKPQHGFARTAPWAVTGSEAIESGGTVLRLRLDDDDGTRTLWPYRFALVLEVTVGASLEVALTVRNIGASPFTVGAALHTYLDVADIARMTVEGLEGLEYVDKVEGGRWKRQRGAVVIGGEVDRVYRGAAGACTVHDAARGRAIVLAQRGSRSTVVWNPWEEKSRRMADFPDDGYHGMVCVEAVNTGEDAPVLAPGEVHTLAQNISVQQGRAAG